MTVEELPVLESTSFPLDATGTSVALYGLVEDGTLQKWDQAGLKWGPPSGAVWQGPKWAEASCDVLSIAATWGVDDDVGCLGVPSAGSWELALYDPDRDLDVGNPTSPFRRMLQLRCPVRIRTPGGADFAVVYLDELVHVIGTAEGTLACVDAFGLLGSSRTSSTFDPFPPGTFWTLAAFVRRILADCNLDGTIGVGSTFAAEGDGWDPLIAPVETKGQSPLDLLRGAMQDVLQYLYVDATGTLQVRGYGFVLDSGVTLGDGGICISDLAQSRSAGGVVNVVSDGGGELGRAGWSVKAFGPREFSIDRTAIGGADWASKILLDRDADTRQLLPLDVLPVTETELLNLRNGTPGKSVRVRVTSATPPVDLRVQVVGGTFAAEGGGVWRGSVRGYAPPTDWVYQPPVPGAFPRLTRDYAVPAGSDVDIWYQQDGTHGRVPPGSIDIRAEGSPLSAAGQRRRRILLPVPIDWDDIRGPLVKVALRVALEDVSGPPSSLSMYRVIGDWTADSVDWPGPTVDGVNVLQGLPPGSGAAGTWLEYDVSSLVWYMVPQRLGGKGLPNQGLEVRVALESTVASYWRIYQTGAGEGWAPVFRVTYGGA